MAYSSRNLLDYKANTLQGRVGSWQERAMNEPAKKTKRSRDGCQNCKKYKIKCDRTKPICKVCDRRSLECDYSQKITWISVQDNDSRHPSFKNKRKRTSSTGSVRLPNTEPRKIEELELEPKDDDQQIVIQNDPMSDTVEEYSQIKSMSPTSLLHLEQSFFEFAKIINPDITKVFQTRDSSLIYQHYLNITCSSLDPLNGCGPENISKKFFLPVAINDPATLHGILAISSSQLSHSDESFKELSLVHKSLAYKHLYSLFSSPKRAISLEALSAIICQLSIEIVQSGLKNWKIHINALRKIINQRKEQNIPEDQTTWFIYLRVARYDNFASLTTGEDPLFKAINVNDIPSFRSYHPTIQNIDIIFGCPSDALFFCAELSYISKQLHYKGKPLEDLGYTEQQLRLRLFEILNTEYVLNLTDDWSCIKNMWCSAMGIHFFHCLENRDHDEYTKIHVSNFFKALEYFINLDSFFCANLAWPILKIGSVLEDHSERASLISCLTLFYKKTNIGAFVQLKSLLKEIWESKDMEEFTKPSDWWKFQETRESWDLYLA